MLCPGLKIKFTNKITKDVQEWHYESGLEDYLLETVKEWPCLPETPFVGSMSSKSEAVDWAVVWQPEGGDALSESYVNLIPTIQGGTHVNGLRAGLLDAMREFCEFRNLLPRGIKLTPDDIWDRCSFVLSVKMQDPAFAGKLKNVCHLASVVLLFLVL